MMNFDRYSKCITTVDIILYPVQDPPPDCGCWWTWSHQLVDLTPPTLHTWYIPRHRSYTTVFRYNSENIIFSSLPFRKPCSTIQPTPSSRHSCLLCQLQCCTCVMVMGVLSMWALVVWVVGGLVTDCYYSRVHQHSGLGTVHIIRNQRWQHI